VLVEDPNHPLNPMMKPIERSLDETVKKRLVEVKAREEQNKKPEPWRRSEFSEPSDVVTVKVPTSMVAGAISPAKTSPISAISKEAPPDLAVLTEEPSAKIMSIVWDDARAVDVPGVLDVYRGTTLNFKSNADVIHPVTLVFKKLTDIDFRTDRLVADIRGGVELPSQSPADKTSPLYSLGEYAVVDDDGKLRVYSEFDDWNNFKRLAMPPQPETAVGGYGMPGEDPYLDGVMPGDSMPARGRKRGRANMSETTP
jgi:hypothetical protein